MRFLTSIRAGTLIAATWPALAQLPATPPTQTQTQTQTAPIQAPLAAAAQPAATHRPQVTFATGVLSVSADNSSLNQILREISQATGMKITGGVTDERVYGTYGPADTSTVLSTLLRGTGSNMLLIFDSRQTPQELILTSRGGGPTPPSPSLGRDEGDQDDLPPSRRMRTSRPGNVSTPPAVAIPMPQPAQQPPANVAPAAAADTTDTTTQKSPNGVSTPEEIYQQLIKLQQQPKAPPHE